MAGPQRPEVWVGDLGVCGPRLVEIERSQHLLTAREAQRASTIAVNRDRWIAAHVALHLALQARIGRSVEFVSAGQRTQAKPRVVDWDGDFSLTHSGDLVLIAITTQGNIGVDVEVRRDVRLDARRCRLIEAAGTAVAAAPFAHPDDTMRLLAAWTRLEAIAKARGTGIGAVLETIGLHTSGADETSARAAATRLLGSGPQALAVHDLDLARHDAVAAVAQPVDVGPPAIRDLADLTGR